MKVIIAGGRDFHNYEQLYKVCDNILQDRTNIEIVSGAYYKGADKFGEHYAKEKGYSLKRFPANWNKYGRSAGPKRNEQMAYYADALIAFWDSRSYGTKNMIELAQREGLKLRVFYY